MKVSHDKKGTKNHLNEIRLWVWLSIEPISLRHPSQGGEMVPRFIGPVKVLHMCRPNAVSLNLPAK